MEVIFVAGGKQYMASVGDELYLEKIDTPAGKDVVFTDVLFLNGNVGTPYIEGAKVTAEVVKHGKNKKIIVFHYRAKKKSRKKQGHRQPYTKIKIKKIEG